MDKMALVLGLMMAQTQGAQHSVKQLSLSRDEVFRLRQIREMQKNGPSDPQQVQLGFLEVVSEDEQEITKAGLLEDQKHALE